MALRVRGGVPAGKLAQLITALGSTGECTHLNLFAGVILRSVQCMLARFASSNLKQKLDFFCCATTSFCERVRVQSSKIRT